MKTQQLYVRKTGHGPAIVLVHGFLTSSDYFKQLQRDLSKTFTVVTVDLLGHGKSAKKAKSYTLEAQVAALSQTLDGLEIARPYAVLGHSLGTLVALEYAASHPEHVSNLLLINPPMFSDREAAYASIVGTSLLYKPFLFSKVRTPLWQLMKLVPPLPKSPIRSRDRARVPTPARDDTLQLLLTVNFFELIEKISIRSLVVIGARDRAAYHSALALWQVPSHVTLSCNDSGHHYLKSQPKLATKEVVQFLKNSSASHLLY